jgi:hypothetical protein
MILYLTVTLLTILFLYLLFRVGSGDPIQIGQP